MFDWIKQNPVLSALIAVCIALVLVVVVIFIMVRVKKARSKKSYDIGANVAEELFNNDINKK